MDVCIVNVRSLTSVNKCIGESGDLKLMGRDGKWENELVADTCLMQEA